MLSQFFIAGRQTTKLFQPLKEALNVGSRSIQIFVIASLDPPRDFRWNHRGGPTLFNGIQHGLGIIGFIGQHGPDPAQISQQRGPLRYIGRLSTREQKPHRIAQCIDQRVDFGGEAAP